jgi:cytoskeletal protein CcmA (bactofilin family)
MRWRLLLPLVTIALLLFPGVALAQGATSTDDFLLRIDGPITVNANEQVGTVMVISDNAVISGVVTNDLIVIDGDATITGTVEGTVTIISGTLNLNGNSRVAGDVNVVDSTLNRAPSAAVDGSVNHGSFNWSGWELFAFSAYLWISFTIALIVAGLIFAAVGGRQLMAAGDLMSRQTGSAILAAVIVGIGIPIVAVIAMATVLGIPLGLGLLLFLIPALWFFGYLVAGAKIGVTILRQQSSEHPYLATTLGIILLQAISLVPFLGGLVAFLAGIFGTGALVLLAWNGWRGPTRGTEVPARPAEPAAGD